MKHWPIFWSMMLLLVAVLPACQRTLPPEVNYDPSTAETLRKDFDSFAEP